MPPDYVTFTAKVRPRAGKNSIEFLTRSTDPAGREMFVLKISLKSPPVDGAANAELVKFVSAFFGLRKGDVAILSGETARTKLVRISGITAPVFLARFGA